MTDDLSDDPDSTSPPEPAEHPRRRILAGLPLAPAITVVPEWFCNWYPEICDGDDTECGCSDSPDDPSEPEPSGYGTAYGSSYG